jgi:SAM-dependent methyltransferase
MSYRYDSEFFDFVNASAGRSASLFIKELAKSAFAGAQPSSVLDVGCGRGIWLAAWSRQATARVLGIDGDYVARSSLAIDPSCFLSRDISKPFDLQERFELVQCLEVAEHVPNESADTLIDNLVRHGDVILFSAAVPGQGGEFHVNEQPYEYWRAKFNARGYRMYDAIRSRVRCVDDIEPWYRYNAFLFANGTGVQRLSQLARETMLSDGQPVHNVAPLHWRARCFVLSLVPNAVTTQMARVKHRLANLSRPKVHS